MKSKCQNDFTLSLLSSVEKYWVIGLCMEVIFCFIGAVINRNNPPIWIWLSMIMVGLLCIFITFIVWSIREKYITMPDKGYYGYNHGEILVRLSNNEAIEEAVEGKPIWGTVGSNRAKGVNRVTRIFETFNPNTEREEDISVIVSQKERLSTISFSINFSFNFYEFQDYDWLKKIIKEKENSLYGLLYKKTVAAINECSTEINLEIKKFRDKKIVLESAQENILNIVQKQDLFFNLGLIKKVSVHVGEPSIGACLTVE
jgi:hypothetical protein